MNGKSRRGRPFSAWMDDNRMVSMQYTEIVPPGTRPTDLEEFDPVNGWPQRALSLWNMMMMMMDV